MADNQNLSDNLVPSTESSLLNYGPDLLPVNDLPKVPSYETPAISMQDGADPFADLYTDFDKKFNQTLAKTDYAKQGAVTEFPAEKMQFEKWYQSWDYSDKGFIPWRDNQDVYDSDTNTFKELYRATHYMGPLFFDGFMSGLRTIPDLTEGLFTGNWDAFFNVDEIGAIKQERAYRMGTSTAGGLSTFATGLGIAASNMAGTLIEAQAETALLAFITAESGGATAEVTLPAIGMKWTKVGATIANGFKNISNATKIFKDADKMRDAYRSFKLGEATWTATKGLGKFLNPASNMVEYGVKLYKGEEAFSATKGFGAFFRDFQEMKFALGEAKLEGGTGELQLRDELVNDYMSKNDGRLPDYDTSIKIGEVAKLNGDAITKTNLPVIYYSNRIGFGNLFKGVPGLNKLMAESESSMFKYVDFDTFKDEFVKNIGGTSFKKAYRSGIAGLANYTKANFMEGIQESLQDVISSSSTEYYKKQFFNPSYGGLQVIKGDILNAFGQQVSGQGLSTFLGGFVMGAIPGSVMGGAARAQGLYYRLTNKEGWAEFKAKREAMVDDYVAQLNQVYKDPLKFFDFEMINAGRQGEFAKFMSQATLNKNDKSFYDIKNEQAFEHLYTVLRSGKLELFKDRINTISKLKDEELKEALGFDVEDPNVLRQRIQDINKKIDYIQKRYEISQEKLKNPINLNGLKKDTPEYANAALQFIAFEDARKQAIFAGYSFDRNAERMASILKDINDVKVLSKTSFLDFNILTNPSFYNKEIELLQKEITENKKSDDPSIKELAKQKQLRLDALKKWKSAMISKGAYPFITKNVVDPVTGKKVKQQEVNPQHEAFRTKAQEAFINYAEREGELVDDSVLKDGVNEAFTKFMDYHALYQEQPNLMKSVNIMADPQSFLNLYESHLDEIKKIYSDRDNILRESIQKALSITDENNLINELAKLGFVVDPKDPNKYYKVSGDTFELVKKGSKEEKTINTFIEDYKKATEKKAKEKEAAKKKDEGEKGKKEEGKKPTPPVKKKTEEETKEEEPEEEDLPEEETEMVEEGTYDPEATYINDYFKIPLRKINYKIKWADNGQIAYATWSFVGSKEAPNVERSVNTIQDLEEILRLKTLMDYLTKVQKVYKVEITDTEVLTYGRPGSKQQSKEYKYTGVIPAIFSKTEEVPFFYDLLSEDAKYDFDNDFFTEEITDLEDKNKKDFEEIRVLVKSGINDVLDSVRKAIADKTAAMKEVRTVDQKFITSSTNMVKIFTMKDETRENMQKAVFSMSKDEIKSKMTGKIEKIKPGAPEVVFDKTRNKVRLRVLRQSPAVASTILVDGKAIGYPTYPDVYTFEIDGVIKTANELTKKEFYLFAQDTVSYEDYMANYNTSMSVYNAFADLLDDNKSVQVTNEDLQKIFDITPVFGDYAFTKNKITLSKLEKNGTKLIGVIDKNNVAEAIVPGKSLTEVANNRAIINNYINTLETDSATGEIKKFTNQGRYIAVYTLPNGKPAFVEVTSANLEEDGLDTVFSDIAERLQKTYNENVVADKSGKIEEVKNKNFNRGFDTFTEESGRMPFYIAIPQNPQKPDALSYNITLTVTANGSLVVQFVNTQSKDKEYHKAYVEVKYDEKGNPDIEDFNDMLSKVNAEIVNYNGDNKEADLPILKAEYFKESIPKAAKFSDMAEQVTNVSENIFQNTHMIFTPASELTPDVDAASRKTGKKTTIKSSTTEDPLLPVLSIDVLKDLKQAILDAKNITDLEDMFEEAMTPSSEADFEAWVNVKENIEFIQNDPSILAKIQSAKSQKELQEISLRYSLLAYLDAKIKEIEGAQPAEPPKKKRGGLGLSGIKVDKNKLRQQAASENVEDKDTEEEKNSGKIATTSDNKTAQEINDQYLQDKAELESKFVKNSVVTDAVEYDKAITELEKQFKKDIESLKPKRVPRLKIVDRAEFDDVSVEDIDKFRLWMKKTLPTIDVDADMVAENLVNNRVVVGRFLAYVKMTANGPEIKGSIQTSKEAAFKYHEAFHAVFNLFLTDEQIDNLLTLAKYEVNKKLKSEGKVLSEEVEKMRDEHPSYAEMSTEELTDRYLEEYLADDFDTFKMDQSAPGILGKIKQVFAKLLDFINSLLGRQSELKTFYKEIDKGKFANANVQSNRFTKDLALNNNPVIEKYKIKYGYKAIETLNGETIMTPQYVTESDSQRIIGAVVNSFLHRTAKMPEYNKARVLDGILEDMMKLYQIGPKYNNLSIDKLNRLRMFRDIFTSSEAKEDIKKNANVFLDLMGYTQDLEDDTEYENALEDEGERATTEKFGEKFAQGGFKSFSKYARQYIQSTTYEKQDEFGNQYLDEQTQEPLAFGVNAGVIYNGMVKLMSGVTTEEKFIQRLIHFKNAASEQTVAFINKFLEDTGINEESDYTPVKNKRLFNAIYKPFTLFNVSYRSYLIDPKTGKSKSIRANMRDAASNQYNQWQNNFNSNYQDQWTEKKQKRVLELMTSINDGLKGEFAITEEEFLEKAKELKELERLSGIKIVFEYYKYSALATLRENSKRTASPLTKEQIDFVKSFEGVPVLLSEDISEIMITLGKKESPFITFDDVVVDNTPAGQEEDNNYDSDEDEPDEVVSDEDKADDAVKYEKQMNKGNRSRLMRIAEGNSMFDETVLSSSWLNSEFETVSSHQLPNFHLAYLEDTIKNPAALEKKIMEDPFLMDSYIGQEILNNGEFRQMLNRLRIDRIDGITARKLTELQDGTVLANTKLQVNKRDGITYGKFQDREFLLTNMLMYLEDNEVIRKAGGEEIVASRHLIRVIESKNTGDTINMPVISAVVGKGNKLRLSEEAEKIWMQEFMAEFNRINRVWSERNNPERDIIDNYNDFDNPNSQMRGVKFRTFEDFLGPKMEEYRAIAMSDNPVLNARQKDQLVKIFNEYLLGDEENGGMVDEFIYMLDDAGIIKVMPGGKIMNKMLPAEIYGVKMKNPTDRMNKLFLGTDFKANLAQIFINDYLNTISINKLYYGDQAMSLIDFVDSVKRAAGAAGSGHHMATSLIDESLGINHSHQNSHAITHIDPIYEGKYSKSKKQKWSDGQTWSTVKTARYNAFGLGRLDEYKAQIFDKLERGVPLTAEEIFGINGTIENNAQLKVEKLVYFDGKQYIKTSVFFLTKELTSQLKLSAKRKIDALLAKAAESKLTEKEYLEEAYALQRDNNNWIARPGREILHNKRVEMEKFQDENATTVYSFPASASKMMKRNVSQSLEDFAVSQKQAYKLDNRYMRLQLENTTNKKGGINDSTQMQNIIDAEQNPNTKVTYKGESGVKVKDVIKDYQEALAQKAKVSYLLARNSIFSFEDASKEFEVSVKGGEVTPKLAKFQKKAIENLKKSGASQQLLEFFELQKDPETGEETPSYDLNSPYTRKKYEQLFLAYFRKDVLQQRTPGQALTLTSDWGAYPLKRAKRILDGKVVEWEVVRVDQQEVSGKEYRPMSDREKLENKVSIEEGQLTDEERYEMFVRGEKIPSGVDDYEFFHKSIDDVTEVGQLFTDRLRHNWPVYDEAGNVTGYKSEFMMPHHFKESMEIGPDNELPQDILEAFAARIPGQDKHSAASLDLVDFLPAHYGSMTMLPREVAEISGADNDVDKAYTQFSDFYVKRDREGNPEFIKYGTAVEDADRFVEFFLWNIANNKNLNSEIRDIKEGDENYKKIKTLLDKLYIAKEHILNYKKAGQEYLEELHQVDRAITFMSKVDNLDETSDALEEDYILAEYNKVRGRAAEFVKERILKLDDLISDITREVRRSGSNISVVKNRINEVKREKLLIERVIQMEAMENLNLPTDVEQFLDFEDNLNGEVNIGSLNNTILEAKRVLLTNDYMQEDDRAFEVADQGVLEDLEKDKDIAPYTTPDSTIDNDNYVGKTLAQRNNKEGSRNIGSVVNGQMSNLFLMKNNVKFRRKDADKANQVYILSIDGTEFDTYANERKALITDDYEVVPNFKSKKTRRVMNAGSGYVSVMTDNAKDRRSAKFNLNINAAAIAMDLNGRGIPDKLIAALMLNRNVKAYYNKLKDEKYAINQSEQRTSKKKIAAEMMESLIKKAGGDKAEIKPLTARMILDGISNPTPETDLSIFHHFLNIEKQSKAHGVLAQILKLTKGPTADMNDWDSLIADAYTYLGVGMTNEQFEKSDIPFDVRKLVLESSPVIAMYWKINSQIHDEIGKTVLISRSKIFKAAKNAILGQMRIQYSLAEKVESKLENTLIMYFALRGYIKTLRTYDDELLTVLDNNLVYGTHKGSENITDIIKEARRNNPDNYLINKYLRLTPKTVMQGGKEIINKDNKKKIHTLEPSTYGVLDDYMMQKIHDSFMDLYEKDRKAALSIFAYSIIKDATLFSPNGIMHIFPPHLFKELMGDVMFNVGTIFKKDNLEEYLSQGKKARDFANLFDGTFKEVVADFMEGYLRHVETKYHLKTFNVSSPEVTDKKNKKKEEEEKDLPIRFTVDEVGKLDRNQIIVDLFTNVKPTKVKYKKKAEEDPDSDEESNVEESSKAKYKLDAKAKKQLGDNIKALKKFPYSLFVTNDDQGNIGLQLPYSFKVKTRKGFDVYVLQNITKISDQDKMENARLADVLTDNFNIVAPRAIYKLVEAEGAYGTTPIGRVFGEVPTYSSINDPELIAAEKKALEETPTEEVEEDDEESDLDVSSPDKPLKRPSNVDEEEEPMAQKRDISFLKSKGISVSLKGGEYIYKKNGKVYEFNGSPRELADFFDEDGKLNEKISGKKVAGGKELKSSKKKFYDPAYFPGGKKGKRTGYIPTVSKLQKIEDDEITQKMVDKLLEQDDISTITHYDGKKFVKYIGSKFNQYGIYKTKVEGMSAINLIRSGIKTEINIGVKEHIRDINELFVMEDTEQNSPTFGEQVLLRAVTAPYKSNKKSFNAHQGWDSSVWENRKDMIKKYNELSFRFEYVGDIVDGELVLPEGTPVKTKEKKTTTPSKTEQTKKPVPSAFKKDTYEPEAGSIQETITNRLEETMSESAREAGYLKKEEYKSKRATQFIGKGAFNKNDEPSSTERYRELYAEYDLANTGDYTSDDIIWVSVNGNRAGRVKAIVDGKLQGEYKNIDTAMKAGASIIMDTAEHLASNKYNIGEKEVSEYLSDNGYTRDDKTGIWTPKSKMKKTEEPPAPVKKFSLGLGKLKIDVKALREQAATEFVSDEELNKEKFEPGTEEEARKIDCSKKKK